MRATRVILALGLVVASAATASAQTYTTNFVYAHATNGVVTDGSGAWTSDSNQRCACSSDAPHFRRVR